MTAGKPPVASHSGTPSAMVGDVVARTLLFGGLWWLLAAGNRESLVIGVFAVPFAVWCSLRLFSTTESAHTPNGEHAARIRALALPNFALFFLWQSLSGGWESARFAFGPKSAVKPGFVRYTIKLPAGRPRLYFVQLINMLPGTVSVKLDRNEVLIHALDRESNNDDILASCEAQIAALFNLPATHLTDKDVTPQ